MSLGTLNHSKYKAGDGSGVGDGVGEGGKGVAVGGAVGDGFGVGDGVGEGGKGVAVGKGVGDGFGVGDGVGAGGEGVAVGRMAAVGAISGGATVGVKPGRPSQASNKAAAKNGRMTGKRPKISFSKTNPIPQFLGTGLYHNPTPGLPGLYNHPNHWGRSRE